MKKEQVMMKQVDIIEELVIKNTTVKGLEILFQKNIEDTLEANKMKEVCWWQVFREEQIFMTIYSISKDKDIKEVVTGLQTYYDKLRKETDEWVRAKLCE